MSRNVWSSIEGGLYVLLNMRIKWLRKLDLEVVLGGAWVTDKLRALLEVHDRVDWLRVPYGQGHHYDRSDQANTSPGRHEDAGGPGSGNWIRFGPVAFKSLQPELMKGGTEPVMTAPVEGLLTGVGGDPDEGQGATVSAGLTHPRPAALREAVTARRRLFA